MSGLAFDRFAGACALVVGLGGLTYSILFVILLNTDSSGADGVRNAVLTVSGLLSTAVLVALYGRLRQVDPGFALWALVLGVAAGIGSAAHGGYNLANIVNKPGSIPGAAFPVDPRGLLTFAVTALAVAVISWLILESALLPRGLAYLGFASAVLLVIVYIGRLTVLDPKSPGLLVAAILAGFVVNPAWYVWVGLTLWRAGSPPVASSV